MKVICGIYKITNQVNGKCYIGQSVNIARRWRDHKKTSSDASYNAYDSVLHKAFRKYGIENFSFEVLEECSQESLNAKEIYWINYFNSDDSQRGYNLTPGGDNVGQKCRKLTDEQLQELKRLLKTTLISQTDLAKQFNISQMAVSDINRGISYPDLNEVYPLRPFPLVGPKGVREKKVSCIPKNAHPCKYCGKLTTNKTYCSRECQVKDTSPMEILTDSLTKEVLIKEIREHGYSNTAVNHGTCVKSIKKLCKQYGIPTYKKDFFAWYEEQFPTVKKDLRKKVAKLDTNSGEVLTVYESISVAAKENEIGRTALSNALNKKSPCICGGIKWKFV